MDLNELFRTFFNVTSFSQNLERENINGQIQTNTQGHVQTLWVLALWPVGVLPKLKKKIKLKITFYTCIG